MTENIRKTPVIGQRKALGSGGVPHGFGPAKPCPLRSAHTTILGGNPSIRVSFAEERL